MGKFFNKKIGSWAVSILETTLFGFISGIRESTIEFLEELPENSAKLIYGICLLLFIVVTAAAGTVILSASLILILIQLTGPEVDKVFATGVAFALLGFFYLVVSVILINMVGKSLKSSTEKVTRKMVKKLGK